jgi:hypothetical protein
VLDDDPQCHTVKVFPGLKLRRGADDLTFRAEQSFRQGPAWRDYCEVCFTEDDSRFAECHGFFRVGDAVFR